MLKMLQMCILVSLRSKSTSGNEGFSGSFGFVDAAGISQVRRKRRWKIVKQFETCRNLEVATDVLNLPKEMNAKRDLPSSAKSEEDIAVRPKGALAAHSRQHFADRNAENGEDVTVSSVTLLGGKDTLSLPHSNGVLAASLRMEECGAADGSEFLVSGVKSTKSMALRIGPATIAARATDENTTANDNTFGLKEWKRAGSLRTHVS
jgi:hypothetical protein